MTAVRGREPHAREQLQRQRAVLLFRGHSPAAAEEFAKTDPYVVNGLVKKWYTREWTTVVGLDAEVTI